MSAPPEQTPDNRLGILLMIVTSFVFTVQDAISRHLGAEYNILMVVMIRYWFFAAFVIALAMRQSGGLHRVIASRRPGLQLVRGLLLAAEICVVVLSFVLLGLIETHVAFAIYPLLVTAFAGPILGERAGWRRWTAVGIGFVGVLVILRPGLGVLDPAAIVPMIAATMFALYGLLTRYVSRTDSPATSFFWTGTVGAVAMTAVGIWYWEPMTAVDYGWMALLCMCGALGHWLLIKTYQIAEASAVQPFAYFQLVFATITGIAVFGEKLEAAVVIGAVIVVSAGLFTLLRTRKVQGDANSLGE